MTAPIPPNKRRYRALAKYAATGKQATNEELATPTPAEATMSDADYGRAADSLQNSLAALRVRQSVPKKSP